MEYFVLQRLQRADLNALVTLSVLLEVRSTTEAADRLAKTQSAVSHTLRKLRATFNDDLLIKQGKSFELSTRARALQPVLEKMLSEIDTLITEPEGFSPEYSQREFRVAAPNFYAGSIAGLSERVRSYSEKLSLHLLAPSQHSFSELLENQLDLLIAPTVQHYPGSIRRYNFQTVDWCVYASVGHVVSNRTIRRQWDKWPHVQVHTGNTSRSPVDDALASKGINRKIALRLPDFVTAMAAVSRSQSLLFTAPGKPLEAFAGTMQLKVLRCPLPLPEIPMSVYTSKIRGQRADVDWLLEQVLVGG